MKKLMCLLIVLVAVVLATNVAFAKDSEKTKTKKSEQTPAAAPDDDDDDDDGEAGVDLAYNFPENSPEAKAADVLITTIGGGGKYGDEAVGGGGFGLGVWIRETQHFGILPKLHANFLTSADAELSLSILFGGRMYGDVFRAGGGLSLATLVSLQGDKDPAQKTLVPDDDDVMTTNTTPKKEKVGVWRGLGMEFPLFADIRFTEDLPLWFHLTLVPGVMWNRFHEAQGTIFAGGGLAFGL